MKIFIDSADIEKIKLAWTWGIIDGVTTNPSHVAKTGRKHLDVYREICDLIDGLISLETVTLTAAEMLEEGRGLAKYTKTSSSNLPITKEGLKAVKTFSAEGIKTNVTVTFLLCKLCWRPSAVPLTSVLLWGGSMRLDILAWMWFAK